MADAPMLTGVPMARSTNQRDPFQVKLDAKASADFLHWLTAEIQAGCDARSRYMADGGLIDTWHDLYEQAERPRTGPWSDGADLASWIPSEKVDALGSRFAQIIFGVDPVCSVEGWGENPERSALVESFHQWKADDERLRSWVRKTVHQSLIEGNGLLEVSERVTLRKFKTQGRFNLHQIDGVTQFDAKGQPIPAQQDGQYVPFTGNPETDPSVTMAYEERTAVCAGPQYRVLSGKDFLFLPAHARDMSEVWGFAKRLYRRLPELQYAAKTGHFDAAAVLKLGTGQERETTAQERRLDITVASSQDGSTAEKELWEVQLLKDIDDDGVEEWLMTTVSVRNSAILRLQFDDLKQTRYLSCTPYPRATSIWGYSFVGHKLWTITDEHTAQRNMMADRSALATAAPIMRLSTGLWNPDEQPWGTKAVIAVRTMDEIKQAEVHDVPQSVIYNIRATESAAERITGLNDQAVIGAAGDKVTATQIETEAHASFVRVDDPMHFVQEFIADLYQLRHRIWERTLAADPKGLTVPQDKLIGLESRGLTLPTDGPFVVTSEMLAGNWKFLPKGSSDKSNPGTKRNDFNLAVAQGIPAIMKMFPLAAQQLQSNPKFTDALLREFFTLYGMTDLIPLLGTQGAPAPAPGMPMTGAAGMPPGMPPPPGGPAAPGGMDLPALLSALGSQHNGAGATPAAPPAGLPPPVPVPPPALTQ